MSRPEAVPDPEDDVAGAFREFREYARGNLETDHHDVHPIAGLIDDDAVRQVLMFMAENYDRRQIAEIANDSARRRRAEESDEDLDPDSVDLGDDAVDPLELPATFWRTDLAEQAIRQYATGSAADAIRRGDAHRISYITGLPNYRADVSGLHAVDQISDWLVHSEEVKLVYMAAFMGSGKTDLSLTLMQIVYRHYQRIDKATEESTPTPKFAANLEVETPLDDEVEGDDGLVEHIDNYDDLVEWAEKGSTEEVRWFVFDEASTELTAQSGKKAQIVAETLAPFVKKMRKLGVNLIVIGHDKGDVHVAIRSMADFIAKTGLKSATWYAGIKDREPAGELFSVSGIPQTGWTYDTEDMATWDWGSAIDDGEVAVEGMSDDEVREERNERIARLYELTEVSYADLATAFDVSKSTVSTAVNAHEFERKEVAT